MDGNTRIQRMNFRNWLKYFKNDGFLLSNEMRKLVFEKRNKSYGAYVIRGQYLRNYCIAWALTYVIVLGLYLLSELEITKPQTHLDYMVEVQLEAPPEFLLPEKKSAVQKRDNQPANLPVKKTEQVKVVEESTDTERKQDEKTSINDQKPDSLILNSGLEGQDSDPSSGDGELAVDFADVMPQYPGGQVALSRYIHSKLIYPKEAAIGHIEGIVVVGFVVDAYGRVRQPKIIKPLFPACDAEALRVVRSIPDWNPGKNRGRNVSVQFKIPIEFKLAR